MLLTPPSESETAAVTAALERALDHHHLIGVRLRFDTLLDAFDVAVIGAAPPECGEDDPEVDEEPGTVTLRGAPWRCIGYLGPSADVEVARQLLELAVAEMRPVLDAAETNTSRNARRMLRGIVRGSRVATAAE